MGRFSLLVFACGLALAGAPALALQDGSVSREVVQAVPSAQVQALNIALRRLAVNGRNIDALNDAGNAALALGDTEAALGFFRRAINVSASDVEANLGMASVYMRSQRPVEALQYFAAAERAGADMALIASDRGLAYDLLGENTLAQESYRSALNKGADPEITRRLAISYAISGDRGSFNDVLRPLVLERDVAAYRARAFGLAILGEMNEAKGLVKTVIPRDLSARIIPYLEFMPRLTKAQQAAAANLGIFPKAAEIGREDSAIIAYRSQLQGQPAANQAARESVERSGALSDPNTERHWVQLAAGRDRKALLRDWDRLQRSASAELAAYRPHVITANRMSRLLAGPFPDQRSAQDMVGRLSNKRVDGFTIKTSPGAKVEQIQ
ncbi:SPOR domain-containing protein [Altererythrobacter sp. JGD-16]|uniref:SPOR domain-containing protein n=2 Tax=Altererythrobacter lutimaris TaxID=2743979 RepID=A0A850H6B1_9SPHN|nr:SPOR domain-containing protein [Altererythrobacter lutimaris]